VPTLRSHTHLQATQAKAQTKACKRVCLPNRTRTVQTRHERPLTERRAATNSTLAIGGVSSPLDSFVVSESSQLRTNFCAEKPAHRQSAKRYLQP
jgi:hypothetical protein